MEKIPTADSVLKVFHRIATVEGGYVPPVVEPEEKARESRTTGPEKKKKHGSNNGRRGAKVAKDPKTLEKKESKNSENGDLRDGGSGPSPTRSMNRKVTFDNFMAATLYIHSDAFTHFDAYRGFTAAVQQGRLTSNFDETTNEFVVKKAELSLEEIASEMLDKKMFIHAVQCCGLALTEYNEKKVEGENANELPPPQTDFANDIQRKNEEAQRAMDAADVFATQLLSALPDKCDSNHFNKASNFANALHIALVEDISFGAKLSIDILGTGLLAKYQHSLRQAYLSFKNGDTLRWPAELEENLIDARSFPEFIYALCATSVDIGQSSDLMVALTSLLELMGLHEDLPDGGGASWIRSDPQNDDSVTDARILASNPNASIVVSRIDGDDVPGADGLFTNSLNIRDPDLAQTIHNAARTSEIRISKLLRDLEMDDQLGGANRGFKGTKGVNIALDKSANPHQWHPMPCIIREVLRAPDAPLPVENLMEAALSYHNVSHYDAAIKTYGAAREVWMEEENYNRQEYIDMMKEEDIDYNPETDPKLDKPLIPPRSEIFCCVVLVVSMKVMEMMKWRFRATWKLEELL